MLFLESKLSHQGKYNELSSTAVNNVFLRKRLEKLAEETILHVY